MSPVRLKVGGISLGPVLQDRGQARLHLLMTHEQLTGAFQIPPRWTSQGFPS